MTTLVLLLGLVQTAITGTYNNPDGTVVNGKVTIQLTLPNVTNSCTTPVLVTTLRPISVSIKSGTLGTLSLYPSTCLSVVTPSPGVPFVATGLAAGGGATVTMGMGSTSVLGSFTLTTGMTPLAGVKIVGQANNPASTLVTMILNTANGNQPYCMTGPVTTNAIFSGATSAFQIGQKTTTMTLTAGPTALSASTAYTWNYSCVQPYTVIVSDSTGKLLYRGMWSVPNQMTADVTVLDRQ